MKPVVDGICSNNPIIKQVLGICSALAVTGYVSTTITMGLALIFVTSFSSLFVSLIRNSIPNRVRMIIEMLLISVLVIVVHLFLKAYMFDMSKALGPYVSLIITNCIVLGRCEACALQHGPVKSFLDGVGNATGYALVLLAISFVREPLGHGTLLGFQVIPKGYDIMLISGPAGAFLVMATVVWIIRSIFPEQEPTEHPEAE